MSRVFALLAVMLVACGGKNDPPAPSPASGSASGGSGPAVAVVEAAPSIDAPSGPVELLHSYSASVQVSSHVQNKTIKPEHLVDKDFNTAWNSRTAELAGAWIEVHVGGAKIDEIKLTVGHTGKGPKGEDYFTMNPRIKQVYVSDSSGKVLVKVPLDPNIRALQTIKLPAPHNRVRITVDEVTMGTKTRWREVCVSEIEAWGTPDPLATPKPGNPLVYVNTSDLPKAARMEKGAPVDAHLMCEELMKPLEQDFKARGGGSLEDPGPECDPVHTKTDIGVAPWDSVLMWRLAYNSAHGPMQCQLMARTNDGDFVIGDELGCGPWDDDGLTLLGATAEDVIPGGDPELVVKFVPARAELPVHFYVCRVAFKAVQCTKSYAIETDTYKLSPRFSKGTVIFDPVSGKAPTELAGPQSLNFDH